ncbi:uncharacterized protein ASPGLDRAFT_1285103 [Aspergillus glaucus CBS 516.65]|uniref:Secreted protein n=1 Tax=Aspergillus glaucus CBS 516.65 TaxID=1160497 RepID=A0A1L9VPH6_ASPGL|nr:hypothetical protein ASPGLDRAFT_1285103 [Aspergillus glaucus CBS 516.65]OJJ85825.1 hypothetical protein ASPGLDRAFT_1285103 [Aspergillus glaucus CBS 516.65]
MGRFFFFFFFFFWQTTLYTIRMLGARPPVSCTRAVAVIVNSPGSNPTQINTTRSRCLFEPKGPKNRRTAHVTTLGLQPILRQQ